MLFEHKTDYMTVSYESDIIFSRKINVTVNNQTETHLISNIEANYIQSRINKELNSDSDKKTIGNFVCKVYYELVI